MSADSESDRGQLVDLRNAIVWLPESASLAERKAAEMLGSEIKRRNRIFLPTSTRLLGSRPHIIVCSFDKLPPLDTHPKRRWEVVEKP
ncbi:hypothetical protein [Fervidibacter sacchari]